VDDGDGAFAIEMLAGQSPQDILQTMYNGSAPCQGCGAMMNPLTTLYTGNMCPDCMTKKGAKRAQELFGR
jgi:hypothetical protein